LGGLAFKILKNILQRPFGLGNKDFLLNPFGGYFNFLDSYL